MKIKNKIVIAAGLLLLSLQSHADSPSFTYVGAEYVASGDIDITDGQLSADVGLDGFAIYASIELGIFFFQASQTELESDPILGATIEDSTSTLAAGITFELPQTQLYGLVRGRYDDLSLRGGGFSENVDGGVVGVEVGARVNITDRFEVNAHLGKPSSDDGNSYGVGAQFFITDNVGLTLDFRSLEVEDSGIEATFDTTSLGVRFTF